MTSLGKRTFAEGQIGENLGAEIDPFEEAKSNPGSQSQAEGYDSLSIDPENPDEENRNKQKRRSKNDF